MILRGHFRTLMIIPKAYADIGRATPAVSGRAITTPIHSWPWRCVRYIELPEIGNRNRSWYMDVGVEHDELAKIVA